MSDREAAEAVRKGGDTPKMSATSPHVDGSSHPDRTHFAGTSSIDRDGVAGTSSAGRSSKAKATDKARLLTIDDLDKRTLSAKYALQLRSALINERGGEGNMSVLKLAAADQVSILNAIVSDLSTRWLRGDEVDLSELVSVTNAFRRASEQLGDAPKPQAKVVIDHDDTAQRRQMARALVQVLEGADADEDDFDGMPSDWPEDAADELVRRTAAAAAKDVPTQPAPAPAPEPAEPSSSEILAALQGLSPWPTGKPKAAPQVGEVELVGDAGFFIELLMIGNDGREKWAINDANGERMSAVWGKADAIAACNTLIKGGTITRRGAA